MNHQLLEKLIDLGLQDNEAQIYVALLELGSGTVTQISSRANLNRTTGYDILERLGLYGLVNRSIHRKKKRVYVPEPPFRLKQYLENTKRQAERRVKDVDSVLPELKSLYKTELKPTIKIAEGTEAMTQMYMNALKAKGTIYSILNLKGYAETFDEIGRIQSTERHRLGIEEKVLAIKSDVAEWWYDRAYVGKKHLQKSTEYRWLDWDDRYNTAGEINIFDDTVIALLNKPEESVAFEIQSQTFADFLKLVFEMAWKSSGRKSSS